MTIPAPTYISPADVKANSLIVGLTGLSDPQITILIQNAETMIDAYVGPQKHHWKDLNTDRVFPREQDVDSTGAVIIPLQLSIATLRQVEWLFTQWWANSATDELPLQHDIASEDIGGDGSYAYKAVRDGLDLSQATIAPQCRAILDSRFRSKFGGIDVTDPLSNAPVRRALTTNQSLPSSLTPYGYPV